MTVRLPPGMKEALERYADEHQLKRNAVVVEAIQQMIGVPRQEPPKKVSSKEIKAAAKVLACAHPRDKLKVLPYGTFCSCGVRVR